MKRKYRIVQMWDDGPFMIQAKHWIWWTDIGAQSTLEAAEQRALELRKWREKRTVIKEIEFEA